MENKPVAILPRCQSQRKLVEHGNCTPRVPGHDTRLRLGRAGLTRGAARMNEGLRDFRPELRAAIERLHRAGFDPEAYVLTASLEGAYGSALEMVRSIGGAVARVHRSVSGVAPVEISGALEAMLREIGEVAAVLTPAAVAEMSTTVMLPACGSS